MTSSELSRLLRLAASSFACYAMVQRPDLEIAPFHHEVIDALEAIERGHIDRLMLLMPPRHGKSLLCTELYPAWYLGRHPDRWVINATYGQRLSDAFGRKVRNLVSSPIHRLTFPSFHLADRSSGQFTTTQGGSYYAVGRGGSITGRGAHLLLLDDLLKGSEEARSPVIRAGLHEWFATDAYTRLQPGGAIINLQTRWNADDFAGRQLREHGLDWHTLEFPAIAERKDGFRQKGEALWPNRFSLQQLLKIREQIGFAAFEKLYQQRPASDDETIFKRNWWRFYDEEDNPCPSQFSRVIYSWDTAYKTGSQHDFSVCTVWGRTPTPFRFYLIGYWRGRVEFPELKRMAVAMVKTGRYGAILIEDVASGQSLIQELQHLTHITVIPVKADVDKLTRAQSATPVIEAGEVFLPAKAPWLQEFLNELSEFPLGAHDDIVDSVVQALNYLRRTQEPQVAIYPQFV